MNTAPTIDSLPENEQIMMAIIGIHETGVWGRDYAKVTYDPTDAGGLSVGWGQLALQTETRLLEKAFESYTEDDNAQYKDELLPWLDKLYLWDASDADSRASSRIAQGDKDLHTLLKKMADDPAWKAIQDERFLMEFAIAKQTMDDLWVEMDLLKMAIWDNRIQGPQWMLDRVVSVLHGGHKRQATYAGVLKHGVRDHYGTRWSGKLKYDPNDEFDFLWAYLLLRLHYLMYETSGAGPGSSYRVSHLLWMAEHGHTTFKWGLPFRTLKPDWAHGRVWAITPSLLQD